MWTEEQRRIYRREGGGYPSDLRHAEWARSSTAIAKGCRCESSSIPPPFRTAAGRVGARQDTPALPLARTGLGRWRLQPPAGRRNRRLAKDFENLVTTLETFLT